MQNGVWQLGVLALRGCQAVDRVVRRGLDSRVGRAVSDGLARFSDWAWARLRGEMTRSERAMLDSLREDREPGCLLRTRSRADVGQWCNPWWGGARLWLAVFDAEIVIFAAGRRPHVTRYAIETLGESRYNAVMAELMLIGNDGETYTLGLPPLDGVRVMNNVSK
jgi:hypothetical protein